jgi:hypothetical protein
MASKKLMTKTMPYTTASYQAAEAWLDESGTYELVDVNDADAVLESLARAFHDFAAGQRQSADGSKP